MVQSRVAALEPPNEKLGELAKQKTQLYAKAGELSGLIEARTRWVTILNDLHDRLTPGMWLTCVKTMPPKDEKSPPRLEIRGMAFSDEVSNQAITEYVAKLKGIGFFTDDLQIKRIKPVEGTDFATEFTVDVGLNDKPSVKAVESAVKPPAKAVEQQPKAGGNENDGKGNA